MKVLFRVDASPEIGLGHLSRCMTLANTFLNVGSEVIFVCRELPGHRLDLLSNSNFKLVHLPFTKGDLDTEKSLTTYQRWLGASQAVDASQTIAACLSHGPIDLVVCDSYGLDFQWEQQLKSHCRKLMVIDDLADRKHSCDILLDQNLYADAQSRYQNKVSAACIQLLGPKYALLKPKFSELRNNSVITDGTIKSILVFFGGSDATNETTKVLHALAPFPDLQIDVIIGAMNSHQKMLMQDFGQQENISLLQHTTLIAEQIATADLVLGGCGVSTWERACLGKPALVITTAINQVTIANYAQQAGLIRYIGHYDKVGVEKVRDSLKAIITKPHELKVMAKNAYNTVDGLGVKRVHEVINMVDAIRNEVINNA